MSEAGTKENLPPGLRKTAEGRLDPGSVGDVIEWFLNFDERTARMRLGATDELFAWKQSDDAANGVGTYPFENAESRFAVGAFQALNENDSEPLLGLWLNDVLAALHDARTTRAEIAEANKIDETSPESALKKAERLTTTAEKRLYLTSCWLEVLLTAEARVLGWAYQELYGRPFTPAT